MKTLIIIIDQNVILVVVEGLISEPIPNLEHLFVDLFPSSELVRDYLFELQALEINPLDLLDQNGLCIWSHQKHPHNFLFLKPLGRKEKTLEEIVTESFSQFMSSPHFDVLKNFKKPGGFPNVSFLESNPDYESSLNKMLEENDFQWFTEPVLIDSPEAQKLFEAAFYPEVEDDRFTLKPFIGFTSMTSSQMEKFQYTDSYSFRVGFLTKTKLTNSFSVLFEAGQEFCNPGATYTTMALNFKKDNWWFKFGKIASLPTLFRPSPLTQASQAETYSSATLPGQANLTLVGGWKIKGKIGFTLNVAERGKFLGDSTEYGAQLTLGNFELAGYMIDSVSNYGAILKFKSKPFEQFIHFKEGLLASYSQVNLKKNWAVGLDVVYHYDKPIFPKEKEGDVAELLFIKTFTYQVSEKWNAYGMFCLGIKTRGIATLYFQIAI